MSITADMTYRAHTAGNRANRECIVHLFRTARQTHRDDPTATHGHATVGGYHLAAIAMRDADPLGPSISESCEEVTELLVEEGWRRGVVVSFMEDAAAFAVEEVKRRLAAAE